jgi:hypothetical protein
LLSHGSVMAEWLPHHQHHLQHLTSSTSTEKGQVDYFCWAVTLTFFSNSLGCLKSFSDFHLSVFGHHSHSQASLRLP